MALRYLKDRPTYIALELAQAHLSVSLSCSLYLKSSLDLVDTRADEHHSRTQILAGLHDLQLYANDYLLEHLKFLTNLKTTMTVQGDDWALLLDCLNRFATKHQEMLALFPHLQIDEEGETVTQDEAWHTLEIPSVSKRLLTRLLNFRRVASSREDSASSSKGKWGILETIILY